MSIGNKLCKNSISLTHKSNVRSIYISFGLYIFAEVPRLVCSTFDKILIGMLTSPYLLKVTIQKHAGTCEFEFSFMKHFVNSFFLDDFFDGENLL